MGNYKNDATFLAFMKRSQNYFIKHFKQKKKNLMKHDFR